MTIKVRNLASDAVRLLKNEERRLEELYAMKILDSATEERFDQYTQLSIDFFGVPIAFISFVDKDRVWFKSVQGLDVCETPREVSLCAHAVHEPEMLIIPDAKADPRFATNPFVEGEPGIRFYAGAVIRGRDGDPLGTCCIADCRPRTLSKREEAGLWRLARMVERELQLTLEAESLTRRLEAHALLDTETGLPNRALFNARLEKAIEAASKRSTSLLLALVRVDRFEALHAAVGKDGAAYLVGELAQRLQEATHPACLIGHVREDNLGVLLPLLKNPSPRPTLERLLACVREPFMLAEHPVVLSLSIGASIFPRHAADGDTLVKRARTALWSRAVSERSGYHLYQRRHSTAASREFKLEAAMRQAFEGEEFSLAFQPKFDLQTRSLLGAEALLRWSNELLGDVPLATFLPIAESSGLIIDIGQWVLDAACKQIGHWSAAGYACPEIAVNITSAQLRQSDFHSKIMRLLQRHQFGPGQLNLEVTEGSLVEDIEGAVVIMQRLRDLGVTFSIDDFGTGFSSLSYLRKMPIDVLKIDRSFVTNVLESAEDRKLVRSIISMAHDLDLKVVAEGVETETQLAFLQSVRCDQAQGYLFSPPLAAEAFETFLATESDAGKRTPTEPRAKRSGSAIGRRAAVSNETHVITSD